MKAPTAVVRLPVVLLKKVDWWAEKQADPTSRSDAVARLVAIGLDTAK